jgi:hypothetical protein
MRGVPAAAANPQRVPMSHVLPAQQTWPLAPHALHVPVATAASVAPPPPATLHTPPVWQTLPVQHAPPRLPQFWQVRAALPPGFAQPSPVLHVLPAQQPWSTAPHGAHIAAAPAPWHERPVPQALAPLPWQQAPPLVPHAVHIDVLPPSPGVTVQRAPDAVQALPTTLPQQV